MIPESKCSNETASSAIEAPVTESAPGVLSACKKWLILNLTSFGDQTVHASLPGKILKTPVAVDHRSTSNAQELSFKSHKAPLLVAAKFASAVPENMASGSAITRTSVSQDTQPSGEYATLVELAFALTANPLESATKSPGSIVVDPPVAKANTPLSLSQLISLASLAAMFMR